MNQTRPLGDRVEAALLQVTDPRDCQSIVETGRVEHVTVDEGSVTVTVHTEGLDDAEAELLHSDVREQVIDLDGVSDLSIETATSSGGPTAEFDQVIAVASAKGGVGKSTVATGIACAFASDRDVALFDADLHGPNVPDLLDLSGPVRADEAGDPMPIEDDRGPGMDVMSVGLLQNGAPPGWRGAMAHEATQDLLSGTAWRRTGTLVVDLPPGTGDVPLTVLDELAVDGVVLVTTPFHTSVADTRRSVELFRDEGVPVLGAVVNMASFTCPSCGDEHDLFPDGDPLADLPVPTLGEIAFDPDLQSGPEPGTVPPAIESVAAETAASLERVTAPETPDADLDIRGLAPDQRRRRVREAFEAAERGAEITLLSDRNPTPVADFLADVAGVATPRDALAEFAVQRRGADWLARFRKPTA